MATRRKLKRPKPAPVKRTARSLDDVEVPEPASTAIEKRSTYTVRAAEIRRQAAQDFITDPDGRKVEDLWNRGDRPYRDMVTLGTFQRWATEDDWLPRRERFWLEVEQRVYEQMGHKIALQRFQEVEELTTASNAMAEYLRPLVDRGTGMPQRHPDMLQNGQPNPLAGLPVFPLELPPMDKFIKSFVDVQKLLMLKRGEVTARSEERKVPTGGGALDPVSREVPWTPSDIRALARKALELRQPELQGASLEDLLGIEEEDNGAIDVDALEDEDG